MHSCMAHAASFNCTSLGSTVVPPISDASICGNAAKLLDSVETGRLDLGEESTPLVDGAQAVRGDVVFRVAGDFWAAGIDARSLNSRSAV